LFVPDTYGDAISDEYRVSIFGNIAAMYQTSEWDKRGYTDFQEYLNILNGETELDGAEYASIAVGAPGGTGYVSSSSTFWSYILPETINSIEMK